MLYWDANFMFRYLHNYFRSYWYVNINIVNSAKFDFIFLRWTNNCLKFGFLIFTSFQTWYTGYLFIICYSMENKNENQDKYCKPGEKTCCLHKFLRKTKDLLPGAVTPDSIKVNYCSGICK